MRGEGWARVFSATCNGAVSFFEAGANLDVAVPLTASATFGASSPGALGASAARDSTASAAEAPNRSLNMFGVIDGASVTAGSTGARSDNAANDSLMARVVERVGFGRAT